MEKNSYYLTSSYMNKVYSALIIANGALAIMEASIYFTFWVSMSLKKGKLDKMTLYK